MLRVFLVVALSVSIAVADVPTSAPPATTQATTTASFAGTFSDGRLTAVLGVAPASKAKAGQYVGTITIDGKTFDAVASPKQIDGLNGLAGTFNAGGNSFPFTAVPEGSGLLLRSADADYHLKNITPPAAVPATLPAP